MNTFRSGRVIGAHQIPVDFLCHKGNHGSRRLAHRHQRRMQGHISVNLILLHALCPEALTAAAHIPVAHLLHKVLQYLGGLGDTVLVQIIVHLAHNSIQPGEKPLVHDRQFFVVQCML